MKTKLGIGLNWWQKLYLEIRFWLSKPRKCRICGFQQRNPAYFADLWSADDLCLECAGFKAVYIEWDLREQEQLEQRYSELMSAIADLEAGDRPLEPSNQPQRGDNG